MQSTSTLRTLSRVLRHPALRAHLPTARPLHTTSSRPLETISAADLTFGQPLHETHPHLLHPGQLTPGITAQEYADRRLKLAEALPPNSVAILAAAELKYRRGPVFYKYNQEANFYYLTGFNEPEALAIIEKKGWGGEHNFHLYVRPKDPRVEIWEGSRSGAQAALDVFNADESGDVYDVTSVLSKMLAGAAEIYTDIPIKAKKRTKFSELIFGSAVAKSQRLGELLSKGNVKPLQPMMNELRVVKSEAEIANLRRAGQASSRAFTEAMRQQWHTERDLETFIEYKFKANGCEESAYVPVVAGGVRANQIHYTRNDDVLDPEQLVVVDAGGEYGGYITDITRSWPVSGKFSPAQKDMYEMILGVQRSCVSLCRQDANLSLDRLHSIADAGLKDGLRHLGFDLSQAGAAALFPHHLGHYIGLSVHDAPGYPRTGSLKTGQCVTIEPGVYVEDDERWPKHFRGMGIRIEDSICVQDETPFNMTTEAVKEVVDIEALRRSDELRSRVLEAFAAAAAAAAAVTTTLPSQQAVVPCLSGRRARWMAAVSLLPSPLPLHTMATTRRVPLASNPNAANSPFRSQSLHVKRPRPRNADFHAEDDAQPPQKKQAVDISTNGSRGQPDPFNDAAAVSGSRKDSKPSAEFQRRLAGARDASKSLQTETQAGRQEKSHADVDTVRQWRKHYRKVFPTFVFYFESLSHDTAHRASRQVALLGAREEKFFSKAVTHIVTSRPIPAANTTSDSRHPSQPPSRTINPSLLDKASDAHRSRQILDNASQRRSQAQAGNTDVLVKAKEMNIKIWALEKFDRMMHTMFEVDDIQAAEEAARAKAQENDLALLLKHERENRPTHAAPWQEIIPFKGYYIYIHDMDEKVKPVMMREYTKVSNREESEWPIFRSVSSGRCPFIEEPVESKEDRARRKLRESQKLEQERLRKHASVAARTRSATRSPQKAPLQQTENTANVMAKPAVPTASTFEAPKIRNPISGNLDSMPPMLGSTRANFQGIARNPGGEPTASGMQRNITSAIRSQMISSTAAAPGAGRVGTSKEMHQLQRRVFEQRTGSNVSAQNSMGSSYLNDVRAAINTDSRRAVRRGDGNTLGRIHEDEPVEEETSQPQAPVTRKRAAAKREREPKPGYCENCRDKYDDFLEHVESRKHQKFALSNENFHDLDALLAKLSRR